MLALGLTALFSLYVLGYLGLMLSRFYYRRKYTLSRMAASLADRPRDPTPVLSVIVPARNEEERIGRCIEGLLAQSWLGADYEIIVVDDRSTDRTAEIVEELAQDHDCLRLIPAPPLRPGWVGKTNGCAGGAEVARGEYLAFVDADTILEPEALKRAVRVFRGERLDFMSVIPRQEVVGWAEKIMMPWVFLMIAHGVALQRINDPEEPDALANGQFLLFSRSSYDAIGGHEIVRGEFLEDVVFARLAKSQGHRFMLVHAEDLASTRMYTDLRDVWQGFSRILAETSAIATPFQVVRSCCQALILGVGSLVVAGAAAQAWVAEEPYAGVTALLALASLGILAGIWAGLLSVVRALPYLPCYPLGFLFYCLVLPHSYYVSYYGERVWKERSYDSRQLVKADR